MKLASFFAMAAAVLSSPADAAVGDRWISGLYSFEHMADADNVVLLSWSRRAEGGGKLLGYLFFPGLTDGQFGGSTANGVYVLLEGGNCDKVLEGPNGASSHNYGKAIIVFHDPPPPTAWTVILGTCDGPPMAGNAFRAEPVK